MSPLSEVAVPREEIARIARTALQLSGASTAVADLLVDAALFAEDRGMRGVGVAHLLDYLHAIDAGRLDGNAVPRWERVAPGFISCDAQGGTFHAGFDAAFDELVTAAQSLGVAVFVQSGAFAGGSSGGSPSVSRRTGWWRWAPSTPMRSLPLRRVPVASWAPTRCRIRFLGWSSRS